VLGPAGGFAGMFRLDYNEKLFKRNYRDPVLIGCTDGVGTKVKLAAQLRIYHTVGIDCVAMNVNDLIVQGGEPLFFLDYLGLHKVIPEETARLVEGVVTGCQIAGCALLGGETAEMPDIYAPGDFDIAGFAVGVVELERAVDPTRVEKGDIIIGLASSGVHSNGFALLRRIIDRAGLRLDSVYPELAAESLSSRLKPQAPGLLDRLGEGTLGRVLLEPTRIYVRPVVRLLQQYKVKKVVSGMAHITGSGLPGNVCRALPPALDAAIDARAWTPHPIFAFLQERGGIERAEMLNVFNMGIGYTLIVRQSFAESIVRQLTRAGEAAVIIGEVVTGSGRVRLD
jgi:phosphoribosylformylglycinamidine cyclo-ligase